MRTFPLIADLVIDIAREIQLRAVQTTPVVPLTQTQGQVMRYVHTHAGCSASDIADGSGLQRANVSTALRELRGRGYITSRRDDEDGRAIRIEATELADETIQKLRGSWASAGRTRVADRIIRRRRGAGIRHRNPLAHPRGPACRPRNQTLPPGLSRRRHEPRRLDLPVATHL